MLNREYCKYLFHTNRNLIVFLFLSCFLIYPFLIFFLDRQTRHSQAIDGCIWYCLVIVVLAFCIPIYMQNKRLKKRSVDTFYALPIKKETMFHTEMVFGLLITLLPWMFSFFLGVGQYWIKERSFAEGKEWMILLVCVIYGCIQYCINYFLAGKCNNTLDGIITVIAYNGLPVVVYLVALTFIDANTVGINGYDVLDFSGMSPYSALYSLVYYFAHRLRYPRMTLEFPIGILTGSLHSLLGILAYRRSCHDYVSKPLEEAEQKTTSPWSYRFLIPVNCLLYLSLATYNNGIPWMVLVSVFVFLGYLAATFVSNRAIKITSRSILFFVTVMLVMNGFTYVFRASKAFGLNEIFPENYASVELGLYLYFDSEEMNLNLEENLSDEKIIEEIQALQRQCIDRYYEGQEKTIGTLWVSYKNGSGKNIRTYNYAITEGDEKNLVEMLKEKGIEFEVIKWDAKAE